MARQIADGPGRSLGLVWFSAAASLLALSAVLALPDDLVTGAIAGTATASALSSLLVLTPPGPKSL